MTDGPTEFGRLRGAGTRRQLGRLEMEKRISAFLREGNVCVMATCLNDRPRATPIEYYSDGLTIYIAASRGTKLPNLEANPRVSVGIYSTPYTDWTDWYQVRGLQITARPELLRFNEQPEAYVAALQIYDWRKYRRALGKADEEPRKTTVVKLTPERIEFRDLGLLRDGCAVLQTWTDEGTND